MSAPKDSKKLDINNNINQTAVLESKKVKELADSYELLLELEELGIVGYTNQEMAEEADKMRKCTSESLKNFMVP
ncbi:35371_t:CDS:2 [Racocetra persica]|uniref:35371_t:CDS:1 n=1 Tax=Racocetra persica TaxID=160502 RepID=A0ACA9LFX7_9GLOM|nr:35371_t:CDS:2 [Racocetra persica]